MSVIFEVPDRCDCCHTDDSWSRLSYHADGSVSDDMGDSWTARTLTQQEQDKAWLNYYDYVVERGSDPLNEFFAIKRHYHRKRRYNVALRPKVTRRSGELMKRVWMDAHKLRSQKWTDWDLVSNRWPQQELWQYLEFCLHGRFSEFAWNGNTEWCWDEYIALVSKDDNVRVSKYKQWTILSVAVDVKVKRSDNAVAKELRKAARAAAKRMS